jgi:plasmid stabilization system protein ParE
MITLIFSDAAIEDIYRLTEFLFETYPTQALKTGEIIINGLQVLVTHPLVGVKSDGGLRKLVISRGRSGYVAIYDYDKLKERVTVIAIKHQREDEFH